MQALYKCAFLLMHSHVIYSKLRTALYLGATHPDHFACHIHVCTMNKQTDLPVNVDSIRTKRIHTLSYCLYVGIFYRSVHKLKSTPLIPTLIDVKLHVLYFNSKLFRICTSIFYGLCMLFITI